MLYLLIWIYCTDIARGSVLNVDDSLLSATPIPLSFRALYPTAVGCISLKHKPKLLFGSPDTVTGRQVDFFDSHPVEHRIQYLKNLVKGTGRLVHHVSSQNVHSQYQLSSRFIDVRVLKLLIRIASHWPRADESRLQTACDVIAFLRNKYPHVSYEYLTPQYILDWYSVIGQGDRVRLERFSDTNTEANENSTKPNLVQLRRKSWEQFFLLPRIERLEKTGYGSIF